MKKEWIEVTRYDGEGYQPLVDYQSWRVAILNYCEELEIDHISKMQKHCETDEVFVLLDGECTLFTGGIGEEIGELDAIVMEPYQIYNVKRNVWHTHTLNRRGKVLIVENQDTTEINSPCIDLSMEERGVLRKIFDRIPVKEKSMV